MNASGESSVFIGTRFSVFILCKPKNDRSDNEGWTDKQHCVFFSEHFGYEYEGVQDAANEQGNPRRRDSGLSPLNPPLYLPILRPAEVSRWLRQHPRPSCIHSTLTVVPRLPVGTPVPVNLLSYGLWIVTALQSPACVREVVL
jgi:hypothetical protein